MKMANTYKETRHISASSLRQLCISMNWYTKGDNEEYGHLLLDLAEHKANLETSDIIEIAEDIAAHSDLSSVCPEGDAISSIAFEVARIATVTFEKEPGPAEINEHGCVVCYGCPVEGCIHRDAFRRNPVSTGGLGLCPRLK